MSLIYFDFSVFYGKVKFGRQYVFEWEQRPLKENLQQMTKLSEDLCFLYFNFDPRALSTPVPGLYTGTRPICSNISETAWPRPIKAKFHVEPQWEILIYINGHGHMTKIAASPLKTF